MAECQAKTFGEALEKGGNEDSDTLSRLVADGIISSEEEEQVVERLIQAIPEALGAARGASTVAAAPEAAP